MIQSWCSDELFSKVWREVLLNSADETSIALKELPNGTSAEIPEPQL